MPPLRIIAPDSPSQAPTLYQPLRLSVEDTPGNQAAPGLLRFANDEAAIAEHDKQVQRTTDIANQTLDLQQTLDQQRQQLLTDPDTATRDQRFQQFAQSEVARRTQGMDDETKALFLAHVEPMAGAMSIGVRDQARRDAAASGLINLRSANDALISKAVDAPTPLEHDAILAQVKGNIDNALSSKFLTPAEYQAEIKNTLVKADQAAALKAIRINPGAAATSLASNQAFPNLDVVTRERLIDSANNEGRARTAQALAIEARNDRVQARQVKAIGDEYEKQITDAMQPGAAQPLTPDLLAKARPFLTPETYARAMHSFAGGASVDDKDFVAKVVPQLDQGDMTDQLTAGLKANQLTIGSFNSYMNRNRELLKDDGPASPYKRGRSLVNDTLSPGTMLDADSAKLANYARAQALNEYDTFADANRDAIKKNPQIASDMAQDIVRRYRLINYDQIGQAIGLPQGFNGTRDTISPQDIDQLGKQALQDYDAGHLSQAEKTLRLRKLEQWDEIIKQRDAARAAAQGKPAAGAGGH